MSLFKKVCRFSSYPFDILEREVWTAVSGQGKMVLDGYVRKRGMGDVIVISPEAKLTGDH